ncbi:MAG: HesA/MoeB/ThiF family protein [Candidatus Heimdallarchaeota archaeon]|nr:HesA/MoeB/ThiF family protein [Candidatus Heimdallarchaeota archaeon]
MNFLSDTERIRYSRQIVLPDIGEEGQLKLKRARILIAGMGGLGTFSSLLLAEIGVGFLRIVDRDIVEHTNLHRTPLYTTKDLNRAKVEVAAERLKRLNPELVVEPFACHLDASNIEELMEDIDIVIDALDNFETRRIINRESYKRKIPLLFAGVGARSGNLAIFNLKEDSLCLDCLYHGILDDELETCDIIGIHPALLPIITGIQIHEAIEVIIKGSSILDGSLLFIDLNSLNFDQIPIHKNPICPVCSTENYIQDFESINDYRVLDICGGDNYMFVPGKKKIFELEKIYNDLKSLYSISTKGKLAVTIDFTNNIKITLFKGGNVLIRGSSSPENAQQIWDTLKTKISG